MESKKLDTQTIKEQTVRQMRDKFMVSSQMTGRQYAYDNQKIGRQCRWTDRCQKDVCDRQVITRYNTRQNKHLQRLVLEREKCQL